ncbi:hypothetical protein DF185_19815 [Marinifilum breve]|uniref:Uncharacterized protein n=1 Tax=Marinifilum breve TaxID=2184082 RepID=A0A2V3ZT54_9BACT|nr:hypothetical protein [Marinifilum breve]PXX96889.1 hypothetical protein DF185_19815 [Marinifilum breve]
MIEKIKAWIKLKLGVTSIENRLINQKTRIETLENHLRNLINIVAEVNDTNQTILSHVRFLNKEFCVAADVNFKYEPSVLIIMKRGKEEIVKTYTFHPDEIMQLYQILEGFGRENTRIDKPRMSAGPRFKY